jgi:putative restriction endonuclease
MTTYVGLTDRDWFNFLSRRAGLDEVNFWQPSASTTFVALKLGEPLLFKLTAQQLYHWRRVFSPTGTRLPLSLAWDAFGQKNGHDLVERP